MTSPTSSATLRNSASCAVLSLFKRPSSRLRSLPNAANQLSTSDRATDFQILTAQDIALTRLNNEIVYEIVDHVEF